MHLRKSKVREKSTLTARHDEAAGIKFKDCRRVVEKNSIHFSSIWSLFKGETMAKSLYSIDLEVAFLYYMLLLLFIASTTLSISVNIAAARFSS